MAHATVFMNNRSQAVRLPADMRFADDVKKVHVRQVGADRILTPADRRWDSFFQDTPAVDDDFLPERPVQRPSRREAL